MFCAIVTAGVISLSASSSSLAIPRRTGSRTAAPRRYAEPPQFDRRIRDVFYPDAREVLGELPDAPAVAASPAASSTPNPPAARTRSSNPHNTATSGTAWSELITSAALEGAVKQVNQRLARTLARPGGFKRPDAFRQVKGDFALLALLLGIVADYDGDVRWQDRAAAVRDSVARADWAEATDEAYADANRRHELLAAMLRGDNLGLPAPEATPRWSDLAARRLLMASTQATLDDSIAKELDARRLTPTAQASLAADAQLVALTARVFADESYEFGDDESFREFAQAAEARAGALRRAVEAGELPQAREALVQLRHSCEECHESYRIDGG
ncbi:MAG: cytochrome c [Planctomycetales bacterium]|nr:cytochrome c [Planctomycetales bacterium]